jgi:hypothetical protein
MIDTIAHLALKKPSLKYMCTVLYFVIHLFKNSKLTNVHVYTKCTFQSEIRPVASHWQTLSHNCTPRPDRDLNSQHQWW